VTGDTQLQVWVILYMQQATSGYIHIEYQVKLQIVSLSLQIAVLSETQVSPFLQIDFTLFTNPVSRFLQI